MCPGPRTERSRACGRHPWGSWLCAQQEALFTFRKHLRWDFSLLPLLTPSGQAVFPAALGAPWGAVVPAAGREQGGEDGALRLKGAVAPAHRPAVSVTGLHVLLASASEEQTPASTDLGSKRGPPVSFGKDCESIRGP